MSYLAPLTFIGILSFSLITFCLTFLVRSKRILCGAIRASMVVTFVNYLFMYVLYLYNQDDLYGNYHIPFYLLYGPMLYYGITSLRKEILIKKKNLFHLLPFIFICIIVILQYRKWISIEDTVNIPMMHIPFILLPISLISYVMWSFLTEMTELTNEFRAERNLFIFLKILMILISMLSLTIFLSGMLDQGGLPIHFAQLMGFLCMLLYVLSYFIYLLNNVFNTTKELIDNSTIYTTDLKVLSPLQSPMYKHSALTLEQLIKYEQNLRYAMLEANIFLDRSLSLTSLAQHLKMPKHHLTEVLSRRIKKKFNDFINTLRVDHACKLLKDPNLHMKLEDIAQNSGFNSKISFNRYFKTLYNCTPSQYRAKHRNQT